MSNQNRRLKWALLIGAIAAVIAAYIGAQVFSPDDNNGKVILVPTAKGAPLRLLVSIGHKDPLLAHYTEHLVWLPNIGKNSRPEDRDSNAWTNDYAVGYWQSGPSDDLPDMLQKMKAVFDPITLSPAFAEEERDILLREHDLRKASDPQVQIIEEMDSYLYAGNAIAASAIGTPAEIRALRYEDAKAQHAATHRPERARLVVIGDISQARLRRELMAAGFPDLEAMPQEIAPLPFVLAAQETRTFRFPIANSGPRMIWRKVVSLDRPQDFDLLAVQTALLRDILDTNLPGGLAGPLRFDAFVTKTFAISVAPLDEGHVELIFSAEPDKGVSFAAMQQAFEQALTASAKGIPEPTYERVRDRFNGFWPNWSNADETSEWMANYSVERAFNLRAPKTAQALQQIDQQIDATSTNHLLAALTGPGRTAIAFIGKDQTP